MDEKAHQVRVVSRHCMVKTRELEQELLSSHQHVLHERKHLGQDENQGYWLAGYLQAVKDIHNILKQGEEAGEPRRRFSCR